MEKPKHGGKRLGAGRKPEGRPPATAVRRIPWEYRDRVEDLIEIYELLKGWREKAKDKSGPRWEKVNQLLEECK